MPTVIPKRIWAGQDVYIIGGGPSLKGFDWNLLKGLKTIGCNDAYQLGAEICKVCIFGDAKWWRHHKDGLAAYRGLIYAAEPSLTVKQLPEGVQSVKRYAKGICEDGLGWNGNTGMLALNLAILMGAKRIYLLGFDMKRTPQDSNWHPNTLDKNPDSVYAKFLDWMKYVEKDWHNKFSDVEIYNVTDDSALNIFPKISATTFWPERKMAG